MRLRYCPKCDVYTMKYDCPGCGSKSLGAHPARFSPVDKLSKYRLSVKKSHNLLKTQQPQQPL